MRSKRVPDRVHVVRPPEQDDYERDTTPNQVSKNQDIEIVRILAQISDKLKRSEAERYALKNELHQHQKSLAHLEDKTDNTEKAFLTIESKLNHKNTQDNEVAERQEKLESELKRTLKATEEKFVKSVAGQAVIDRRLKETEERQSLINERLDETITQQSRLDRQLELSAQDKSRITRKIERLEEIITETQDTLRAKAMVLLTDQSPDAHNNILPSPSDWKKPNVDLSDSDEEGNEWWRNLLSVQTIGISSLVIAALLGGWTINQLQQPKIPEMPVAIESIERPVENNIVIESNEKPAVAIPEEMNIPDVTFTPTIEGDPAPNYSEDQPLMDAINGTKTSVPEMVMPETPTIGTPVVIEDMSANDLVSEPLPEAIISAPQITPSMPNFAEVAFQQNAELEKQIFAEVNDEPLAQRIKPDNNLPAVVKQIEALAFKSSGESQHDLAAIYTAGHGGVEQNFERAAFWFREASDQGIGNARYNLGVLYHQGLGVERDLDRALYWYREAARLDHAEAQYNLGIAHIEGIGTEYNPQLAAEFFERAANNGIIESAYNLGLIYENGLLGDAKPDEALLWYKIAATQGSPDAKNAMEQLAKTLQIGMKDVDILVERMQAINEATKGRRAGPDTLNNGHVSTMSARKAMVAQIQEYLSLTGVYSGPIDGINGAKTANAIRKYQSENGLEENGEPSQEILKSMMNNAIQILENKQN